MKIKRLLWSGLFFNGLFFNGLGLLGSINAAQAEIPGLAPQSQYDLDGYISYRLNGYLIDNQSDTVEQALQQRVNYEYRFNPDWRFNAGLRNRIVHGGTVTANGYADWLERDSGYVNLSANWVEQGNVVANSQLDRLYFTWQGEEWLITTGRARINWGMTTIWNPNDIFNSYSVYETDYAERPGTDGIMLNRELDFASGIDLVFSPDQDSDLNRYAARYYFNHNEWDVQLIAGQSYQDRVIGVGFAGAMLDAGVRGEASYFSPDDISPDNTAPSERQATLVSSLETDYLLASQRNWSFRAALLYTSHPVVAASSSEYLTQTMSVRTLSFSKITAYAEAGADLSELNRATLALIYYQDDSFYLSFTNTYSLADNWQLTASMQRFDGSASSLFGRTPTTSLYATIRWDW